MHEVTISLPAVESDYIANLEKIETETLSSETQAIAAIRERYHQFARHNGNVLIASYEASTANWSVDNELYLEDPVGKRVKALKCFDSFDRNKDQEFSGSLDGHRLYLSERGEWIELERVGHWSAYQGSPNYWGCGEFVGPDDWECDLSGGHVRIMTDAEVATEYELSAILKRLAESLGTLNTKLPERMTRVKQRAELAARLLDALKS